MKILAIDTAGEACSVALQIDQHCLEKFVIAPRGHVQFVLPMIEKILIEANVTLAMLDAIAFSAGPASFTGIRIGAGIVQGLAYGANLPVIPISSLASLAQGAWRTQSVEHAYVCQNAHMQEVYWGWYQKEICMQIMGEDHLSKPAELPLPPTDQEWIGIGNGWTQYAAIIPDTIVPQMIISMPSSARDVVALAAEKYKKNEMQTIEQALPIYLREKTAWHSELR